MPTQAGFWIQVKNGEVKQVWDYKPDPARMAEEGGWRAAVEVKPDLVDGREIITTHSFDLNADPAQIVWGKRALTVDERKDGLKSQAKFAFQQVVNAELRKELDEYPETQYDAAVVDAARQTYEARINQINAAATHEQVDAL
jgi:hypothetical protein